MAHEAEAHTPRLADVHYLDDPLSASIVAQTIARDIAVIHYRATGGTAFGPDKREEAARARKETKNPLPIVSIVSIWSQTKNWIDLDRIHPSLLPVISENQLQIFENLNFLLLPANEHARQGVITPWSINCDGEFQVFLVPDQDPIMKPLITQHRQPYYLVRSSNFEGEEERHTVADIVEYAQHLGAAAIGLPDKEFASREHLRKRIMSQPIIRLPQATDSQPGIILRRAGNTAPETMAKLVSGITKSTGLNFTYQETKAPSFTRPQYSSPFSEPGEIRKDLLAASLIE